MDNLGFGLQATAIGMAIVFAVLAILWGLLLVVARIDARPSAGIAADAAEAGAGGATTPVAAGSVRLVGAPDGLDPRLVAAITVAIVRHEEARRLQAAPAMRSYWPGSLLFASRWVAAGRTRQGQTWRRRR